MNKKIIVGLALAGALSGASARASYAESVVDYTSGNLPSSVAGFTNAASALGEPSRVTSGAFGGPVDPFNAPYLKSQVVSLGTNGSLTVRMTQPVGNDPAHPYGLDFIVYGNAGFNIVNGDYAGGGITDGSLYGAGTGWARVYVSADSVTYYALNSALAPMVDSLFPTDGSGDFSAPVNPALTGADFADKGMTDIRRLYQGAGGGAGFDLAWAEDAQGRRVTLDNVRFIKVVSLAGHVEIGGFSLVAAVPEPAIGALVLLGVGMVLIKGLGARHGWIALLIWLAAAGVEAATISEDFSSDPLAQGWKVFGKASLFQWNAANQNLEVTWDSSQGNSYFYRPLPDVLGKNDDFSLAFELQLKDVAVGLSSDKPFTFEVAVGLFNREQAMGTNFVRGTAKQSPNLAEFDYFPDSGFGATVSLALVSSNHQFLSSMNYPLEMTAGDYFQVTMRYTASNRTLRTVMTRNGESFGPIQDLKVSAAFTDFQVDTVAISSYNDEPSGGSLLAHGVVDNLTVTVPEPPITVFVGEMVDGLWQAEFVGRVGWTYGLEQTSDFRTWTEIAGPMPGTGGGQVLTDTKRASGAWFYRVRAER